MLEKLSLSLFYDTELILLLLLCTLVFFIITLIFTRIPNKKNDTEKSEKKHSFYKSKASIKLNKKDAYIILLVTCFYAIISLHELGSTIMPSTYWQPTNKTQSVVFELADPSFNDIYIIGQEGDNNNTFEGYQLGFHDLKIYGSNDATNYELITTLEDYSYLQWEIISGDYNYQYIKIETSDLKTTITEIGFHQKDQQSFIPVSVYQDIDDPLYDATLMIDEQDEIPLKQTYMTNTYFDEVYHPRNATEIVEGQHMYAHVHPLLGTSIMALGIKIFGANPFGFRIMGALFGILMLPLVYVFAKRIFNKTYFAAITMILFAADFMHITTSRIATLEPFSIFFIIAMFFFMSEYYYSSFYDTSLKKQFAYLALSGLFMGMAISTKWTGCYGAVGLAIIFFTNIINRYLEYRKAKQMIANDQFPMAEDINMAHMIVNSFYEKLFKTILWCILWFVIIPIIIYFASYLITPVWRDGWSIKNVIDQIIYMYEYHIDLEATHPFESVWWQWILDIRPIWYYTGHEGNIYHTISCLNNPLINWVSVITLPLSAYFTIRYRNRTGFFILVGYLSNLAPWFLVTRCVFSYHYYPSVIFMILSIVFIIKIILQKHPKMEKYVNFYIIAVVICFIIYLPITCGFGTTYEFSQFLEIFPSWNF
ncbi:MAG: phospholipid carrier-dependent glycosyltransferase [Erysipelotrichaceae bacterium]|nr:phospholipid carrier-dependent glycosyltransferase [Erysipelotrichaceae bacterium]MDY5251133.1 phospholipid carrier-dependent glycosyltransferase [Erysipelotrichaceae bacterium]